MKYSIVMYNTLPAMFLRSSHSNGQIWLNQTLVLRLQSPAYLIICVIYKKKYWKLFWATPTHTGETMKTTTIGFSCTQYCIVYIIYSSISLLPAIQIKKNKKKQWDKTAPCTAADLKLLTAASTIPKNVSSTSFIISKKG